MWWSSVLPFYCDLCSVMVFLCVTTHTYHSRAPWLDTTAAIEKQSGHTLLGDLPEFIMALLIPKPAHLSPQLLVSALSCVKVTLFSGFTNFRSKCRLRPCLSCQRRVAEQGKRIPTSRGAHKTHCHRWPSMACCLITTPLLPVWPDHRVLLPFLSFAVAALSRCLCCTFSH